MNEYMLIRNDGHEAVGIVFVNGLDWYAVPFPPHGPIGPCRNADEAADVVRRMRPT